MRKGEKGRERGGRARLGYLSREPPEFLVTKLPVRPTVES